MTYNHERAKVICPEAAKEVERLRAKVGYLQEIVADMANEMEEMDHLIDGFHFNLDH